MTNREPKSPEKIYIEDNTFLENYIDNGLIFCKFNRINNKYIIVLSPEIVVFISIMFTCGVGYFFSLVKNI